MRASSRLSARAITGCLAVLIFEIVARGAFAAVRPFGADLPATSVVAYDPLEHQYAFTATGSHVVVYTLDLDDDDLVQGMLRIKGAVDGRPPIVIVTKAGTRWRSGSNALLEPYAYAPSAGAQRLSHGLDAGALVLRYREHPGARDLEKTYRLRLEGMSLAIDIDSDATSGADSYGGVSLGWSEPPAGAQGVVLPYQNEGLLLFADGSVLSAFVDPTVSSSVTVSGAAGPGPGGTAFAHGRSIAMPDTAGRAMPLSETAYITLSEDLLDTFPRSTLEAGPYRPALSARLVLDDWSLHGSFSVPEGVALEWTAPTASNANLTLLYADLDPACGDGVKILLEKDGAELARILVPNGDTVVRTWSGDVSLASGGKLRAEIDRNGTNNCDSTRLRLMIDTPAPGVYDSEAQFSSVQGQDGWRYLEFVNASYTAMSWNGSNSTWQGAGAYALLWQGGGHPGVSGRTAFLDAANMVKRYAEYGLSSLAVILHDWQRWGFDSGLPDHYPANPGKGAAGDMAAFTRAARDAGMLVALHENYTDMYPHHPPSYPAPLYDASAAALASDGTVKNAWLNTYTGQQAVRIASGRMRLFALGESPSIAANYHPNAAFLDVTPGWTPAWAIDHDASKGAVPTLARAFSDVVGLYDVLKSVYGGPLLGEGGEGSARFDTYFAGTVDGVERQTERRSRAWVAPDFELRGVKPSMLNHGMGYYARYFPPAGQVVPSPAQADLDQYRASEIAFGHAGFLGDQIADVPHWLRLHAPEYWLMQALQSRYADAAIASVTYENGGIARGLENALRAGVPLERARLTLAYAGGLTVHVNRDASGGIADTSGDFSMAQGERGWRYYEDRGGVLVPMSWDPEFRRWAGSRLNLFLFETGGSPNLYAPVRTWTAPAAATVKVRGAFEDLDTSCGDGVIGSIRKVGSAGPLWTCALPGPPACVPIDLDVPVSAGDVLEFRIDQGGSDICDATSFPITITWPDGENHDWAVMTPEGARTLPPSGFFAWDTAGFRAYTARSGLSVVDYVNSPEYLFARSRGALSRAIEEITTDGGIAIVRGPFGEDLHGLDLTTASRSGRLILDASPRADVNLRWLDTRRLLVAARDASGAAHATVIWGNLPDTWRGILAAHATDLLIAPCDDAESPLGPALPVALDAALNPVLSAIKTDRPYALSLSSQCVASLECAMPLPRCCTGRCAPAPSFTRVAREGADVVLEWSAPCSAADIVRRSASPSDFAGAMEFPAPGGVFRDTGAAAAPANYFYLPR